MDPDLDIDDKDKDETPSGAAASTEKKALTTVGLKGAFNKSDDKKEDGAAADDGDEKTDDKTKGSDEDGDSNESPQGADGAQDEDIKDAEEGEKAGDANETGAAKISSISKDEKKETVAPVKRQDYTLLDELTSFLYSDEDPLPILCGYFLKVMDQLLIKQKQNLLTYLLVEQNGKIFDGLLKHLQHHSLAMFLIKLLEVQIQPERKRETWDGSEGSDFEGNQEPEPELTVE